MAQLVLMVWSWFAMTYLNRQPQSARDNLADSVRRNSTIGVSAHRGASGLAPENTLATFREALRMGVDYMEIDVRTTIDGELVILHDGTLNRTTTGTGPVQEQTLADLKKLSAANGATSRFRNEQIPTLEKVCQLVADWNARHPAPTNLYVDCKDVAPEPLVAILTKYGLLQNAVFYGSDSYLRSLQQVSPTVKLLPGLKRSDTLTDKINALHPFAVDVSWPALTEELVHQLHRQQIQVFTDLLDLDDVPGQYERALRLGVDVIQTDHVLAVYRTVAPGRLKMAQQHSTDPESHKRPAKNK